MRGGIVGEKKCFSVGLSADIKKKRKKRELKC